MTIIVDKANCDTIGVTEPFTLASTSNFIDVEIVPGGDFESLEHCQNDGLAHLTRLIATDLRRRLERGELTIVDNQLIEVIDGELQLP